MLNHRRSLGLPLLCLLVILLTTCAAYKNNQGLTGMTKDVEVRWNGSVVSCDPDIVRVKKDKDKVMWSADHELDIHLPSPYPPPACKKNGSRWSCVSKTFGSADRIKYDALLKVDGDWKRVDPLIEVEP